MNINIKLTKELENSINKFEKLSLLYIRLQLSSPKLHQSPSKLDLIKYGTFITQKSKTLPDLQSLLADRLQSNNFLSLIQTHRDQALLISLQIICDIIVCNLAQTNSVQSRSLISSTPDKNPAKHSTKVPASPLIPLKPFNPYSNSNQPSSKIPSSFYNV